MSVSGRVAAFLGSWQRGLGSPHRADHKQWGADTCDACTAETFDAWAAFQHCLFIARQQPPARAGHDQQRVLDLFFYGVHYDQMADGERSCLDPLAMVTETRERGPASSKIWVLADDRDDAELWMEGAGLAGLDTSKAERLLDPSQLRGAHLPFYVRTASPVCHRWPEMDQALEACGAIDIGPHLNAILARLEQLLGPVGEGGRRLGRGAGGVGKRLLGPLEFHEVTLSADGRGNPHLGIESITQSRGEVDGS